MKKLKLFRTLLVAVMMLGGVSFAWADVTPVSQNYSSDVADWTSGNTGRYTVDMNAAGYLTVNAVGDGNNGTTITGTTVNGKAAAGSDFASSDDFTMTFDLQLTGGSNQKSWFHINDAANSTGYESAENHILSLNLKTADGTVWEINGDADQTVDMSKNTWYTFKLSKSFSKLYLTITPTAGGEPIFAQQAITVNSSKGGLGKMIFQTKRYNSYMAIDNVVLQDLQSGDVPTLTSTSYTIQYRNESDVEIASDIVTSSVVGEEVTATAAQMNPIYYSAKKYLYKSGNETITLVSDASSNVITLVYREAETYTYSLKQKLGTADATTEQTGTKYEDETITLYYPKFVKSGEDYYEIAANGSTPHYGVTLTNANPSFTATYTLNEDIIYYAEIEDIATGLFNQTQCADYASNGNARFFQASTNGNISTSMELVAGKYDVTVASMLRTGTSETLDLYRKTSGGVETKIGTISSSSSSVLGTQKFENISFEAGEELYTQPWTADWSKKLCIDYVYVEKSAVAYTVKYMCGGVEIQDADESRTAKWGTTVTLPSTDKANITKDGKIYTYSRDDASSQTIAVDGSTVITVNFEYAGAAETVTYTLNVGVGSQTTITSENASTSSNLTSLVGITNNTGSSYDTEGGKANLTVKIPTPASYDADNYVSVGFTVADGYKFTPTSISVLAQPVTTAKALKLVLTDGTNSIEKTQASLTAGTITTVTETNDGGTSLTGNVTLKIYCYGATDTYRLGSPITIAGTLGYSNEITDAIADCKTYETSSAFASHIDGLLAAGSLTSVAEVYAAHSAWQIAQAEANGSTDYSKAIMNRTFELHNTNGWTIYGDDSSGAASDNDKYGVVEYGDGWSQYYTGWNGRNVSQNIATLPAGTYRLSATVYSWDGGAPVKLFANGNLSEQEDGNDHTPTFDFTVTGSEESIKIGIGGVGQGSGDNTWGTWGYRVKNFTLTKIAASISITSAGAATLVSPYALNFTGIDAVKAYYASAQNGANVTFTRIDETVAANTPLYVTGSTTSVPVVAMGDAVAGTNLLVAGTGAAVASEADDKYNFILNKVDEEVGFYWANGQNVAVGKAYLSLPTDPFSGSGAKSLNLIFDGEATGISDITRRNDNVEGMNDKLIFNLSGQKLTTPQKGINIINGRKVVVK